MSLNIDYIKLNQNKMGQSVLHILYSFGIIELEGYGGLQNIFYKHQFLKLLVKDDGLYISDYVP
jgi:hypothetical protein